MLFKVNLKVLNHNKLTILSSTSVPSTNRYQGKRKVNRNSNDDPKHVLMNGAGLPLRPSSHNMLRTIKT